jgi:hypothetical protein
MGFFESYSLGRRRGISGVLTVRGQEKREQRKKFEEAQKDSYFNRERKKPVPWRKRLSNR